MAQAPLPGLDSGDNAALARNMDELTGGMTAMDGAGSAGVDVRQVAARKALQVYASERTAQQVKTIERWLASGLPKPVEILLGSGMTPKVRRVLAKCMTLVKGRPGTLVYKQGEVGDSFYVVLSGFVRVFHHRLAYRHKEGSGAGSHPEVASDVDHAAQEAKARAALGVGAAVKAAQELFARRGSDAASAAGAGPGDALHSMDTIHSLGAPVGLLGIGEFFGDDTTKAKQTAKGEETHTPHAHKTSVVMSGTDPDIAGVVHETELLQIPHKVFARCFQRLYEPLHALVGRHAEYLASTALFYDVPGVELAFLATWARKLRVKQGDTIFTEGDPCNWVYVVRKGCVHVDTVYTAPGGSTHRYVLEAVRPPSVFGFAELLVGAPETTGRVRKFRAVSAVYNPDPDDDEETVRAKTQPTELWALPAAFVEHGLLARSPSGEHLNSIAPRLHTVDKARQEWHDMRMDDVLEALKVSYSLFEDVQHEYLPAELLSFHQDDDEPVLARRDRAVSEARSTRGALSGAVPGGGRFLHGAEAAEHMSKERSDVLPLSRIKSIGKLSRLDMLANASFMLPHHHGTASPLDASTLLAAGLVDGPEVDAGGAKSDGSNQSLFDSASENESTGTASDTEGQGHGISAADLSKTDEAKRKAALLAIAKADMAHEHIETVLKAVRIFKGLLAKSKARRRDAAKNKGNSADTDGQVGEVDTGLISGSLQRSVDPASVASPHARRSSRVERRLSLGGGRHRVPRRQVTTAGGVRPARSRQPSLATIYASPLGLDVLRAYRGDADDTPARVNIDEAAGAHLLRRAGSSQTLSQASKLEARALSIKADRAIEKASAAAARSNHASMARRQSQGGARPAALGMGVSRSTSALPARSAGVHSEVVSPLKSPTLAAGSELPRL